jgi:hypothetical protein
VWGVWEDLRIWADPGMLARYGSVGAGLYYPLKRSQKFTLNPPNLTRKIDD